MPTFPPYFTGLRVKGTPLGGRVDRQFYARAQWRHVRALVLERSPLCSDPLGLHARAGRVEPATDVHHVAGRVWNPERAYELENLQALCHACHSRLTRSGA